MGVDMHIHIVDHTNGELLTDNLCDFRNSEWFGKMRRLSGLYENLPVSYGIPFKDVNNLIVADYEHDWGYGFHYLTIKQYKEFFEKYRPDIDAGWFTTYELWMIEKKGHRPYDIRHYLESDDVIEDMHFKEVPAEDDWSKWLYDELIAGGYNDEDYLVYYFDC